jgi:hypothetical protein
MARYCVSRRAIPTMCITTMCINKKIAAMAATSSAIKMMRFYFQGVPRRTRLCTVRQLAKTEIAQNPPGALPWCQCLQSPGALRQLLLNNCRSSGDVQRPA